MILATPPQPVAQAGVEVAGIAVDGLTGPEIRWALEDDVTALLRKPVVLRSGRTTATLRAAQARPAVDLTRTVRRVLAAEAGTDVAPVVTYSREGVRAFVAGFAGRAAVAPVDAQVRIRVHHIGHTRARAGGRVKIGHVAWRVGRVLLQPARSRSLHVGLVRARPRVRVRDLPRRYPSIITVDKSTFRLRLFKRLRYDRSYGVAVGQPAYPTPTGLFAIQSKQVNPTWTAPNSPWAGEAAGQSYSAGDPGNPLAARWMGVNGSVGIHGTYQEWSIGSAASHGCIRMRAADVIDLYRRVGIGTPVLIAN